MVFRDILLRFSELGVREEDGVDLIACVGRKATYVLDPTQLVTAEQWKRELGLTRKRRNRLFCYFLSVPYGEVYNQLERFARRVGCEVDVYVNGPTSVPFSIKNLVWQARQAWCRRLSPVHIRLSAGPWEFVEAIQSARWIVSDSFHALMFSSIFLKEVRLLAPKTKERRTMFGRITNFANQFVSGPLIMNSLEEALASFVNAERVEFDVVALEKERLRSYEWLKCAIENA